MYISLWENYQGHPDYISFMQFSTKIDGFEQKDSQGFENSYNSYEQYPLEKFFIFTIYRFTSYQFIDQCFPHTWPRPIHKRIRSDLGYPATSGPAPRLSE